MATTTNYGWTTPDDTALVKDGAAAIRTLGSSVDTTTKALNPSTTLGDVEYRSSTANTNTRLGIGTTGQVLTVSGGVPAWSTISTAPKVDYVNTTGSEGTSSTSYTALTTATEVTMTTGTKALVIFSAMVSPANAGYLSVAVSGASTVAASDNNSAIFEGAGLTVTVGRPILFTGLTAGSNTFSMQFRANAGTASYSRRNIVVLDMGS
jgi:hypothetical protein